MAWMNISISAYEHRQRGLPSSLWLFHCPFFWQRLVAELEIRVWILFPYWAVCCRLGEGVGLPVLPAGRGPGGQGPGQERREHAPPSPHPPASWQAGLTTPSVCAESREQVQPCRWESVWRPHARDRPVLVLLSSLLEPGREAAGRLPCGWSHRHPPCARPDSQAFAQSSDSPARGLLVHLHRPWCDYSQVGWRVFQGLCFAEFQTKDRSPAHSPHILFPSSTEMAVRLPRPASWVSGSLEGPRMCPTLASSAL